MDKACRLCQSVVLLAAGLEQLTVAVVAQPAQWDPTVGSHIARRTACRGSSQFHKQDMALFPFSSLRFDEIVELERNSRSDVSLAVVKLSLVFFIPWFKPLGTIVGGGQARRAETTKLPITLSSCGAEATRSFTGSRPTTMILPRKRGNLWSAGPFWVAHRPTGLDRLEKPAQLLRHNSTECEVLS